MMLNIPDWLLPQDEEKRARTIMMFWVVLAVFALRLVWHLYLNNFRPPLGLMAIPFIGCPFLLIVSVTLTLVTFVVFNVIKAKHPAPLIVAAVGVFIVFQIPPPPKPPSPEETHFLQHRADYEQVVQLVRAGQLLTDEGHCNYADKLPPTYQYVSAAGCFWHHTDGAIGLVIEFNPLSPSYYPIYYVERPEKVDETHSCRGRGDPLIEKKIDAHWYVCQYDWN